MIREIYSFTPQIEIIDGGTLGLDLLPYLEEQDRVLIIDAVDFGMEPGYIGILGGMVLQSDSRGMLGAEPNRLSGEKISAHNLGLLDLFAVLRLTLTKIPEIFVIGIQPGSVEMGLELTDVLSERMLPIVDRATGLLTDWGIRCEVLVGINEEQPSDLGS